MQIRRAGWGFITFLILLPGALPAESVDADRGDTLAQAREAGQATLQVLYVPAEGWAHTDGDGHLTGVTVEIMREFATWAESEKGIELKLDFVSEEDWSVFYDRVSRAEGGVFGLGNVTITEERREELTFSPPYLHNIAVMISDDRAGTVESAADAPKVLDGYRGLAFSGTLHETRLESLAEEHWPDLEIRSADSNDEILRQVAAGGYFAWIDGYNYFGASERGDSLRRHPAMDDPGETFGIIMPLDTDWEPAMTAFFEHGDGFLESDTYRKLLETHLGKDVAAMLTR